MGHIERRVWSGKASYRARYRDPAGRERSKSFSRKADAERWLREYLQKEGPRAKFADAKREATKAGITEKVLRRARGKLGVTGRCSVAVSR